MVSPGIMRAQLVAPLKHHSTMGLKGGPIQGRFILCHSIVK